MPEITAVPVPPPIWVIVIVTLNGTVPESVPELRLVTFWIFRILAFVDPVRGSEPGNPLLLEPV